MPRDVLLIEPNYRNKYPPMGLMKLSTYFKRRGDKVRFYKGDLQHLVVVLLCEDLIKRLDAIAPDVNWNKYTPSFTSYIRYGRNADIPESPEFEDSFILDTIQEHRDKYKKKQYLQHPKFDLVGVTTLFTFHWGITIDTINFVKKLCKDPRRVIVGGIASSILPKEIEEETDIKPIVGVLDQPGMIDGGDETIIDTLPLDYSILEEIDYKYPATDAYFAYMTRGCPNRCSFCAVPTLEPEFQEYHSIREQLRIDQERFGEQRNLLLLDNNVFASSSFNKIINEIKASGFEKGAKYIPSNPYEIAINNLRDGVNDRAYIRVCVRLYQDLLNKCGNTHICSDKSIYNELYMHIVDAGCDYDYTASKEAILELDEYIAPLYKKYAYRPVARQRYVDFNQGIDARLVTPEKMKKLAEINIKPLRIAFDHWGLRNIYERAVRLAAEAGIQSLSNYMLYNYEEQPIELYYRMKLTVDLCDELGITIYSFPMKYHPIRDPKYFRNRDFIGRYWNKKYIRAIQAVLTATHGKIGRGKQFFEAAFGRNENEFFEILEMPEHLIINRFEHDEAKREAFGKVEEYTGKESKHICDCMTDKWRESFNALSDEHRLLALKIIHSNHFSDNIIATADPAIQDILAFYK